MPATPRSFSSANPSTAPDVYDPQYVEDMRQRHSSINNPNNHNHNHNNRAAAPNNNNNNNNNDNNDNNENDENDASAAAVSFPSAASYGWCVECCGARCYCDSGCGPDVRVTGNGGGGDNNRDGDNDNDDNDDAADCTDARCGAPYYTTHVLTRLVLLLLTALTFAALLSALLADFAVLQLDAKTYRFALFNEFGSGVPYLSYFIRGGAFQTEAVLVITGLVLSFAAFALSIGFVAARAVGERQALADARELACVGPAEFLRRAARRNAVDRVVAWSMAAATLVVLALCIAIVTHVVSGAWAAGITYSNPWDSSYPRLVTAAGVRADTGLYLVVVALCAAACTLFIMCSGTLTGADLFAKKKVSLPPAKAQQREYGEEQ